jgi:hypothetical protein
MKTDITMLLDRTGSMAAVREDTVGGFNTFLAAQQQEPGECLFSLVQFDDIDPQEVIRVAKPIREVPPLTDFQPRGATPLLDALGRAIVRTGERLKALPERARPEKVIFVILTDGQENASREYSRAKVFEMITHQREVYKWEFVFLGSNQDAIQEALTIGIPRTTSLSYAADSHGTAAAYQVAGGVVSAMRAGLTATITEEERANAMSSSTSSVTVPEPQKSERTA